MLDRDYLKEYLIDCVLNDENSTQLIKGIRHVFDLAEEPEEQITHLKDCETQLIKIRTLLANYEFSPGVSELSVAKPEGIYHLVEELESWYRKSLVGHPNYVRKEEGYSEDY